MLVVDFSGHLYAVLFSGMYWRGFGEEGGDG